MMSRNATKIPKYLENLLQTDSIHCIDFTLYKNKNARVYSGHYKTHKIQIIRDCLASTNNLTSLSILDPLP